MDACSAVERQLKMAVRTKLLGGIPINIESAIVSVSQIDYLVRAANPVSFDPIFHSLTAAFRLY